MVTRCGPGLGSFEHCVPRYPASSPVSSVRQADAANARSSGRRGPRQLLPVRALWPRLDDDERRDGHRETRHATHEDATLSPVGRPGWRESVLQWGLSDGRRLRIAAWASLTLRRAAAMSSSGIPLRRAKHEKLTTVPSESAFPNQASGCDARRKAVCPTCSVGAHNNRGLPSWPDNLRFCCPDPNSSRAAQPAQATNPVCRQSRYDRRHIGSSPRRRCSTPASGGLACCRTDTEGRAPTAHHISRLDGASRPEDGSRTYSESRLSILRAAMPTDALRDARLRSFMMDPSLLLVIQL